ncbi:MAG: TIGR02270 family protein [Geminicoccaceae bacterium]
MHRVLTHIIEQHAEEAAFLWLLRDRVVDAPHYTRRHLASHDQRIEAHLDGLVIAGEVASEIARALLADHQESGELFVLTALALETDASSRLEHAIEVARGSPDCRRGLFSALGWVPAERVGSRVAGWLHAADPFLRLTGLVACSLHRVDPGQRLNKLVDDVEPEVSARACRLAAEVGRADLRAAVAAHEGETPWSAWAGAILGDDAAAHRAAGQALQHEPSLEAAVRRLEMAVATTWIRALNGDPRQRRQVIRALGILGDPVAVPWLLARMAEPEHARLAGESFTLITGAYLDDERLEATEPPSSASMPGDDPDEEIVERNSDEDLLWPDLERASAWWQEHESRFAIGRRHLLGRPIDSESCDEAWRRGYQRQRRAAAYERAVASPGGHLDNWRARIRRHQSA